MKKEFLLVPKKYCVMYNHSDVILCENEKKFIKHNQSIGFKVYGYASTLKEAELLAEEACYLA